MSEILTSREAAAYLKTSPDTVKRLARAGRLPGVKLGHTWRFRRADLEDLFVEAVVDRVLGEEAEAVLSDPNTEWIPLEQVKKELGL